DMPPAVFAHMWSYLRSGRSWMGVIKNRCRNGDHYWVNAYVTPILENSQITGYESVRVKPEPEQVRRATLLYRRMQAGQAPRASRPLGNLATRLAAPLVASGITAAALAQGNYWLSLGTCSALLFGLQIWAQHRQQQFCQRTESADLQRRARPHRTTATGDHQRAGAHPYRPESAQRFCHPDLGAGLHQRRAGRAFRHGPAAATRRS